MPATLLRRTVSIDDKLKHSIIELKPGKRWKDVTDELKARGLDITESIVRNILRGAGKGATQWEVPYETYLKIVGESPRQVITYETPDLAQRIAHWHTRMYGLKREDYAGRILDELQLRKGERHGRNYTAYFMYVILFTNRVQSIDSLVTGVVADFFNYGINDSKLWQFDGMNSMGRSGIVEVVKGSSPPQFESLQDIESFLDYLDANNTGGKKFDRVEGSVAVKIVDRLIKLSGQTFYRLTGRHRRYFEQGKTISAQKYYELERRLHDFEDKAAELMSLAQLLHQITAKRVDGNEMLASYLIGHSAEVSQDDLPFLVEASKNYKTRPFIEHILPVYLAIKKEYGFPEKARKLLASFPPGLKSPQEFAANVGEQLSAYKRILDNNRVVAWPEAEAYARRAEMTANSGEKRTFYKARKELLRAMRISAGGLRAHLIEAREKTGVNYENRKES